MQLIHYNSTLKFPAPSAITVGSFDGVHLGHQFLLRQMNDFARQNYYKTVVVTFDPHPQEILQTQPNFFLINTFEQKITLLEKNGVDAVFIIPFSKEFSKKHATEFLEGDILSRINMRAAFLGPNHHFGTKREGDVHTLKSICEEKNIKTIMTKEFKVGDTKIRSTLIREYLARNDWQNAERFLGHKTYVCPVPQRST